MKATAKAPDPPPSPDPSPGLARPAGPPPTRRVAVIGGGLSGLATAVHLHLADPQLPITLLESSDRVGGVLGSRRLGDLLIDEGADMFATEPDAAFELCRRLGAADRLIEPRSAGRGAMIVRGGRLYPVPDGFVLMRATKFWPVLTTPLLSPIGKSRLLAEPLIPPANSDDDESVADFVRRRLGKETLDRIVAPLVAGIYTADVERLSMRATMRPIVEMERQHGSLTKATLARRLSKQDRVERTSSGARYGQFRAFPGGMQEFVDLLRDALPTAAIRTRSPIDTLRRVPGGWELAGPATEPETFSDVVVATPARNASRLLQTVAPQAADELAAIESASTAIVVLAVPRRSIRRPVTTFGFVVPPIERRQILAASFASAKFAGRAPEDTVLIRVFIGGCLQPELLRHDDAELIRIARRELHDLIGLEPVPPDAVSPEPTSPEAASPEPTSPEPTSPEPTSPEAATSQPASSRAALPENGQAWVIRWDEAMPQYHVGHLRRVDRIRKSIDPLDGLWLVGNAIDGVGIAPLIAAAGRVADAITAAT